VETNLDIQYEFLPGILFQDERVLQECSTLYSEHYGKWGKRAGKKYGTNIKLSVGRLKEWLQKKNTGIYLARYNSKIVGYAIALRKKDKNKTITWITQLVVHTDYRNKKIASDLLQDIWGVSKDYAWGLVSANPYAVRALERATHRKCDPIRIKKDINILLEIGKEYVQYVKEHSNVQLNDTVSLINTEFYSDHAGIPLMLRQVRVNSEWKLGDIREGWEWLAFTFRDQPVGKYSEEEIKHFEYNFDKYVKDAYKRMNLTSSKQSWMKHTEYEVQFIIKECGLCPHDTVLDIGCGTGRHSFELSKRRLAVTAVDYIDNHFNSYKDKADTASEVCFIREDCRNLPLQLRQKFKAVICLYDVIGSYAELDDNVKILQQIYDCLEFNGTALISVMNYDAVSKDTIEDFSYDRLLSLESSSIMETTGNVFNSKYLLVDRNKRIFYRKETFEREHSQPVDLIVRDRRFTKDEIIQICRDAGFKVEFARYVRLGNWEKTLFNNNSSSKEILLKLTKTNYN